MRFGIAIILGWVTLQAFVSSGHDTGIVAKTARELLQSSRLLHFGQPSFEIWNPLDLTKTYRLGCGCWLMNTSASPPNQLQACQAGSPMLSLESPTIIDGFTGKESRPSTKKMQQCSMYVSKTSLLMHSVAKGRFFVKRIDPTKHFFDITCSNLSKLGIKSPKFDL